MTASMQPVFIIGGSRTGSEMLKTMLSTSTELDFVDELFLLTPAWLHRDLQSSIKKNLGKLDESDLDRLIQFLYSGIPEGYFWTVIDKEVDRDILRDELTGSKLSLRSIFLALMNVHAKTMHKNGIGAKFPVHYAYAEKLVEWFPDCRLIHTTRNPKAVYASQAAKYLTSDDGFWLRNFKRFQHFVHINIQVYWTARLHRKLADMPNYMLVRYEDVVREPERELRKICGRLNVEFVEKMLEQHQYGSSFDTIGSGRGVSSSSLDRWKRTISPRTARFLDIVHKTASRSLGYLN